MRAIRASEMPVLPLVGSSSSCPGSRSAASTIASATRSLIEPVGFWPSSLAKMRTPSGAIRGSSSSELAATGHRRQEDDRGAVAHRRVEAVARTHVLAVDVDVDERPDLTLAV